MEKAKKISALILSAAAALLFPGCSGGNPSSNAAGKTFKIDVIQFVQHEALDASYRGFVAGLKSAGYEDGKNIRLEFQNAQNEQSNCVTIANKFANDRPDLILAIATPAAQAVANAVRDTPILVTAVTDPATSKLVQSNEKPGTNVSGTSDLTPVKEQIDLVKQIVPDVKTIGLMYCSSEANSKFQIDIAKKECDAQGIRYLEKTVSNSNEIQQAAQSLVGKVQAVYIPTDNMLAAGMTTVTNVLNPAKIPVVAGESGMVGKGGIATYGINYYKLGQQTAAMAVKILKGKAKPADMPIEYQKDMDVTVNQNVAKQLGITFPQALLAKASSPASSN
jgi:putative ABC transport system substrate-binding protein